MFADNTINTLNCKAYVIILPTRLDQRSFSALRQYTNNECGQQCHSANGHVTNLTYLIWCPNSVTGERGQDLTAGTSDIGGITKTSCCISSVR